jgi:hypothetical protein
MKVNIEVVADTAKEESIVNEGLEAVLMVFANNPNAPDQILEAVAESSIASVRAEVASNPSASLVVLDQLIHDENAEVRAAIAQHPQAVHYCWKLAVDPNPLVRYCTAMNPNFSEAIYVMLAQDSNERVARRAKRTIAKLRSRENPVAVLFDRLTRKAS